MRLQMILRGRVKRFSVEKFHAQYSHWAAA